MSKSFTDYKEARTYAQGEANRMQQSHGIANGREFGRIVFIVRMIPNNPANRYGSDFTCESVEPMIGYTSAQHEESAK